MLVEISNPTEEVYNYQENGVGSNNSVRIKNIQNKKSTIKTSDQNKNNTILKCAITFGVILGICLITYKYNLLAKLSSTSKISKTVVPKT